MICQFCLLFQLNKKQKILNWIHFGSLFLKAKLYNYTHLAKMIEIVETFMSFVDIYKTAYFLHKNCIIMQFAHCTDKSIFLPLILIITASFFSSFGSSKLPMPVSFEATAGLYKPFIAPDKFSSLISSYMERAAF